MIRCLTVIVFALLLGATALAGLPSDYGAAPFDQALSSAQRDGRPVMVYFGEDW